MIRERPAGASGLHYQDVAESARTGPEQRLYDVHECRACGQLIKAGIVVGESTGLDHLDGAVCVHCRLHVLRDRTVRARIDERSCVIAEREDVLAWKQPTDDNVTVALEAVAQFGIS